MKRTALLRCTPISPGKPMTRKIRLRPINKARLRRAYERNFGARARAVRAMRCLVMVPSLPFGVLCRCRTKPDAADVRARGMGGAKSDRRCLVPLCREHHLEAGEFRTSKRAAFELRHGLDLVAEAERIAVELDARGLP